MLRASATPGLDSAPLKVLTTFSSFVAWSPTTADELTANVTLWLRKLPSAPMLLVTFMTWSRALVAWPGATLAPMLTSAGTFTGLISMCWSVMSALSATTMSTLTLAPSQLQPFLRRKNWWLPLQNGSIVLSTPVMKVVFSGAVLAGDQRNSAIRS